MKPTFLCLLLALMLGSAPRASAVVDDAHTFALEAAIPNVNEGYAVREEYWAGWLAKGQQGSIKHQLFGGADYWFWLASDEEAAKVSIHIYDSKGNLVETQSLQKGHMASARVQPKRSGTYYIVFRVDDTKLKRTRWAIAYGYK